MKSLGTYLSRETMAYDRLTVEQLRDEVFSWLAGAQEAETEVGEFTAYHQSVMPRTIFLKNLPQDASVVDLGAGDGGLSMFKSWPAPVRHDLKLYAVSLDKGQYFDQYEGFALGDFDRDLPELNGGPFDALLCCNFLEHIKDPDRCVEWISSVLKPGGRVFMEWPHETWKNMPSMADLSERGYDAYTVNFWDDGTHIDAWPMERVISAMSRSDLNIESSGRIYFPWLGDQLRDHGIENDDMTQRTYGVWLRFGLGQFVVASKAAEAVGHAGIADR